MLEKTCGWCLIWYLLFLCHGGAEGQLQWFVKEKVTAYGQNLILFCPVENCCSEPAGWSVGTKSIIIDVKRFSNDPKVKYHGTYTKDGFGVVIRNLSEADLNVTYRCVYGFDQSTPKYLLHGDVFRENVPDKEKENDTTATIIVVPIVVIILGLIIGMAYCVYRSRGPKQPGTNEEKKVLYHPENQQDAETTQLESIPEISQSDAVEEVAVVNSSIAPNGDSLTDSIPSHPSELPSILNTESDIVENNPVSSEGTNKETENLNPSDSQTKNQQGTNKETENLNPSDSQTKNQQGTNKETENLNPSDSQSKNQQGTNKETENLNPSNSQTKNQQGLRSTKLLVTAIDFGTTYSGYAFSFRHDFEKDPCQVSSHSWIAASSGLVSLKTPTSILLNPQKEFECFGYEAEDKYIELANKDQHEKWYYFRRFKMMLHGQLDIKRDVMVKTVDGKKELPALTIFSMAIKFLKDHMMTTLDKRDTSVQQDDIQWVLTVPAIWNDPAKQFMREAAQKAGIDEDNLILALEPETASIFCKYMPDLFHTFQPGSKYIVLDCGGGTVDITVHQVQEGNSLKELYKANGGDWGGTQVDEAFKQMLIKIIGSNIYLSFYDENPADFVDIFREFELKKRCFSGKEKSIMIKIPASLHDTFEEKTDEKIQDVLPQSPYFGKMKWERDNLRIDSDLFETLFDTTINNIIEHLKNLLQEPEVKGITNIIMVGGFSESPIIQNKVKEGFPDMTVIIPAEAGLTILKGAVIFGHMPRTISSRKAKYTYELETTRKCVKGSHREDKKEFIGDQVKCKDSVDAKKGQTLENDEVQEKKCCNPAEPDQDTILKFDINMFNTQSPMYITCSGYTHIAEVQVSGGQKRPVEVSINYGGTELKVIAMEQKTKKAIPAKLQFLD